MLRLILVTRTFVNRFIPPVVPAPLLGTLQTAEILAIPPKARHNCNNMDGRQGSPNAT
jgi:hypothetical protein